MPSQCTEHWLPIDQIALCSDITQEYVIFPVSKAGVETPLIVKTAATICWTLTLLLWAAALSVSHMILLAYREVDLEPLKIKKLSQRAVEVAQQLRGGCSSRGPQFKSQHLHGSLHLSVTPVLADLASSHRHTCKQNTKHQKINQG